MVAKGCNFGKIARIGSQKTSCNRKANAKNTVNIIPGDYMRLVKYFSTAICKTQTKCFASTKRKPNLNFGV